MSYAIKLKTAYDMSREAERKIRDTTGLKICLIISEYDNSKTPAQLIALVGAALKLDENYGTARSRNRDIVEGRHIAALLLQQYFQNITYAQIGRLFGQNHATIICAVNRAKGLLDSKDLVFTTKFLTAQKAIEQWIND